VKIEPGAKIGDRVNRDAGKEYLVTEMTPYAAESWALRALNVIAASGIDVPDQALNGGMAGLASVAPRLSSFRGIDTDKTQPLLDEMRKKCFSRVEKGNGIVPIIRAINEDAEDLEEISTLLKLRGAWVELHLGFSPAGLLRNWSAAMMGQNRQTTTGTSPDPSE